MARKYYFPGTKIKTYFLNMKKLIFSILLLITPFLIYPQIFSGSKKSPQTTNFKKKSPSIPRTTPKNWGKKKYSNPVQSKLKELTRSIEIGASLGGTNSLTDISGNTEESRGFIWDMQVNQSNLCGGIYGRYKFHRFIAVKGGINYYRIRGADSLGSGSTVDRGNSFTNSIYEFSITGELYRPKPVQLFKRSIDLSFDYYGYTGLSFFYHNPDLTQKQSQEEQNFSNPEYYQNFQVGIPLGLGFFATLPSKYRIGIDAAWVKTFTDYLDGFTRAASEGNDSYLYIRLNVGYIISSGRDKRRW